MTKSYSLAPFFHSFIKQRLYELDNEIYKGEEQIFRIDNVKHKNIFEIKKLNTYILSNSELVEEGDLKEIDSYSDLMRMGYMIVSKKAETRFYRGQSVVYKLKKFNPHISRVKNIPPEHIIEYDEQNDRIRLKGKNAGPLGYGLWVNLEDPDKKEDVSVISYERDYNKLKNKLLSKYTFIVEKPEVIKIPEVPVMISIKGEVVCLEKGGAPPVICITGSRGTGKTILMHSILDRIYWKFGSRVAVLNDSLNQTQMWTLPCDRLIYSRKLNTIFSREIAKINEHPLPLPLGFLYPNTSDLLEMVYEDEGLSHRFTLPFESVIENYNYFLKGNKEWDLGRSLPYFRNIKNEFLSCTTLDDIEEVLIMAVEEEKINKGSKDKINNLLIDIFNQRILDVNTKIPSSWKVKLRTGEEKKLHPVLAMMEAGVIPVIRTQNLLTTDFFPQYMRYVIEAIFDYQIRVVKHRNEKTWLFIDEISDISSTENKTVAAQSLRRCVTEGRSPGLATVYALQNWTKVDRLIRNNTTHLFTYHNLADEAREIARDFHLEKHREQDILKLKKFQVLAVTNNTEKFVVYTPDGERYTTNGPIKGRIIMPLSQHQKPGGSD